MTDVMIYGEIGFETTTASVREQLANADGDIVVRVNSPGGDVYEGIGILNALREYDGDITVVVESAALSAASFIAVGCGGRVVARPYSEIMIHKAWSMVAGNADDVRKKIADLERQDEKIAQIYAESAGGETSEWLDVMAAETWYTAQEALDAGLVDAIEEAKRPEREPVSAFAGSRVYASCRYAGRKDAPAPKISRAETPPEEGKSMSILNQLADELGKSPDDVVKALSGFFNEQVSVEATVDITYPEGVRVAPTEKVTVSPVVDGEEGIPAGAEFAVAEVAEGFDAEVDEAGVVTITAPSGAEPGEKAEFTIDVNGVAVPLVVEVRAVSEDEEEAEEATPSEPLADESVGHRDDVVTLDRDTYNALREAAAHGQKAYEAAEARKLDDEVDEWVRDGRISAALRNKAREAIHRDAQIARDLYGRNPKNTIPRGEVGYGADPEPAESAVNLRDLAQSRLNNK